MDLSAVIFVPALVGSVISGFIFALFAAHYYLTVLQSTGSGSKRVIWLSEPLIDHFWKVFYLVWLIGLWFGPAWMITRVMTRGADAGMARYAIPLVILWICFPVSQMSSLGGPSIWLPLIPEVFGRLARKLPVFAGFMALSGITLAGFGAAFYGVFNAPGIEWLFLASPLLVITGLLYARLLGRLAFVLMFTKSILARKKKKKPTPAVDSAGRANTEKADEEAAEGFVQPSELPPIETPDEGPLSGYDVKYENHRPKTPLRVVAESVKEKKDRPKKRSGKKPQLATRSTEDEDDRPYVVHAPEVQPEERAPVNVVVPSAYEMSLLNRDEAPKPPKQAWKADLLAFLLQADTMTVVLTLTTLSIAAGGMVRIAREFNPVAEVSG